MKKSKKAKNLVSKLLNLCNQNAKKDVEFLIVDFS